MNNKNNISFQTWWQLTSVQVGGVICVPIVMIGVMLGRMFTFAQAVSVIAVGNAILFVLACIIARMASEYKQNTVFNAQRYFAQYGTHIFTFVLAIGCLGWFAIQLDVMATSILQVSSYLPVDFLVMYRYIIITILGALMTLTCLYGIESIEKLSSIAMPLLCATLGYLVYAVSGNSLVMPNNSKEQFFLQGVVLVIAAVLLAVVDMPTYYRFARSKKDAYISVGLLYLFFTPVLEIIGAYVAAHSQGDDIVSILTSGTGIFGLVWTVLFLLLAGWTTNNANIFSAATALKQWFSIPYTYRVLIVGVIGTILAYFDIMKNFETVLELMAIGVSSFGAIIVVQYCLQKMRSRLKINTILNTMSWIIATTFGITSFFGLITLTGFSVVDTFVVALCINSLATIFFVEKNQG